jgi:hypothetical protein
MTDRNINSYLNQREKFKKLLGLFKQGYPITKELNSVRSSLEKLSKKFTGYNTYTPQVDNKVIKYIQDKQFLNKYRRYKGVEIPNNREYNEMLNYANSKYGTENLNMVRNMIVNSMNQPVKKIQNTFRKSRLTNEKYLKLYNKMVLGRSGISRHEKRILGNNTTRTRNIILNKRTSNKQAAPAVLTIQRIFRGYKSRNIDPRKQFLMSLSKDSRFDYYVEVLAKLEHKTDVVLNMVRQNTNPLQAITSVIGVCHYKPNPRIAVSTVRKFFPSMKKITPREYLLAFRKQFSYVAKEYFKMSLKGQADYRDRLHSELSGRPCLENLLDSLAKALVKEEFVWVGKTKKYQNNPLLPDNIRYLGFGGNLRKDQLGLINTALKTWKNLPLKWNNKNLNARKNIFWKMIKNLPLAMVYKNDVVNGTLSLYNKNGIKFKKSNLANQLEYR